MKLYLRDRKNRRLGMFMEKVAIIRNSGEAVSDLILAKQLRVDVELIGRIHELIYIHSDWDDEDIADEILELEEL